jgi:hypothetical protein
MRGFAVPALNRLNPSAHLMSVSAWIAASAWIGRVDPASRSMLPVCGGWC